MISIEKSPYRGKYPDRIAALSSALRSPGQRFASTLIETNNGARFVFDKLHSDSPIPKLGQEIEFWLYHISPTNSQACDTCLRYGVAFNASMVAA